MEQNPTNNSSDSKVSTGGLASGLLFIWDFLKVIIIALLIIVPIRYFVFQPFIVSGDSMKPNFENGQYLVIDELSYRFHEPKRGDVLVLRPPQNQKEYYIKRIIGLPGEKVQIDSGHVTIFNSEHPKGMILAEIYLPDQTSSYPHNSTIVGGKNILTLKSDEYFMMGDNRRYSSDSRDWGPLTSNEIVGKVLIRALPLSEFKLFHTPGYAQ
ncbi:MAG: signal peptidase I [Candidatus Doudnabacteria bacterium]|nr:signal peptidase I [Candidatus Doudnabacteria bacterium]